MHYNLDSLLTPTYSSYPEASDKPIIGITTNTGGEDFSLRQRYCEQVIRAGGVPLLLTPITTTVPGASASGTTIHNPSPNTQHPAPNTQQVWLTERGNSFGYNNLVVDFRNIPDMLQFTPHVIMDCTHSVQRPGGADGKTGGDRRFVPAMAKAAKAFGATGYFFEVHPDPDRGLSDAANMLELDKLESLIKELI